MLDWRNGQPFSPRFGDVFFSSDSGLAEKQHVFLQGNRLAERFASLPSRQAFTVGETGFGTGLSFLCTWQLFETTVLSSGSLDFFSIEKYPLEEQELKDALALWPELQGYASPLITRWNRRVPGWNRWSFAGGRIRLTLVLGDIAEALPEIRGPVDAWFLDGFSPERNPEMWTQQVFDNLARASRGETSFATYTCAGAVRRGLEKAGFRVTRRPGFGCKREMLQGALTSLPQTRPAPATAIVIGGGVAGCAAASSLAMRGAEVKLIERAPALAAGASGNPSGVLHARLSAGMNPLHRFVLASYGHALALLDEKLPVDGIVRVECGELQLAFCVEEAKRIDKLAALGWPSHLMRRVDSREASRLAGIELPHGGLWFPAGGWLVPPRMCATLVNNSAITPYTGHLTESLSPIKSGWRIAGKKEGGQTWSHEAEIVVVCTGHQVKSLGPLADLPVTAVRGQMTLVPATPGSSDLQTVVCGSGYMTPVAKGLHAVGATHCFNDNTVSLRASDHIENLSKLAQISPSLINAVHAASLDAQQLDGRASQRGSVPGAMPLVGELLPGLYTSLGHGTRGLITAGLSGELVAAAAFGQLLPLPSKVVDSLSPARRLAKTAREQVNG